MPTPVDAVRQCLAGEAAAALDGAVAIAQRSAHAQTTSLHVVSSLLSLPSSSPSLLRDALSRARSAVYPSLLQSRALELCFSAALDRLPSTPSGSQQPQAEPPVSNSLMAAIKRSQANQRRNPDPLNVYSQPQQLGSPSAGPKVDLQQLILSILDDPVVSRVLGEAGFRSYDVKVALLRPPTSVLRYPRPGGRRPPLFLCNFSLGADDYDVSSRGFPFPLSSQSLSSDGTDENCKRIADAIIKGRNVLLVGVGGGEATRDFEMAVTSKKWTSFPPELRGLLLFSLENEVREYAGGSCSRPWLDSMFGDLAFRSSSQDCPSSPGMVVCFGDLKGLVDMVVNEEESGVLGRVRYVVAELTRLLDSRRGRVWLMGSAASYETYMKFLSLCPSVDKDWGLQLLPITSLKMGSGDTISRTSSLKESFAPFGGCLPMLSDSSTPLSKQQSPSFPCQLCTDEYEQELAALLREFSAPGEVDYQVNLLSFQHQTGQITVSSGLDMEKAKDDETTLSTRLAILQNKWNKICQHQHRNSKILEKNISSIGTEIHTDGFHCDSDVGRCSGWTSRNVGAQGGNIQKNMLQIISSACDNTGKPIISNDKSESLLTLHHGQPKMSRFQSQSGLSLPGMPVSHISPSSTTSVSTDLKLGTVRTSISKTETPVMHPSIERSHHFHGCLRTRVADVTDRNIPAAKTQQYSSISCSTSLGATRVQTVHSSVLANDVESALDQPKICSSTVSQPFNIQDIKTFNRNLMDKLGRQEDAIHAITDCILRCKADNARFHGARLRGDIWLCFLGPDRIGKRKIAMALADLLFGSRANLISADLNSQDGMLCSNTVCNNQVTNRYELSFRGKTVLDYIAGELHQKPCSVIFLENVDKADLLVQTSLSQAIKTGRFSDSHGREVGISCAIFITTAGTVRSNFDLSSNLNAKYPEERILAAQPWKMKIVAVPASDFVHSELGLGVTGVPKGMHSRSNIAQKRKICMADDGDEECQIVSSIKRTNKNSKSCLDLNLPVEETEEANDAADSNSETDGMSDGIDAAWMEEFLEAVDGSVTFKPFDFDNLANFMLRELTKSFETAVGSQYVLEVDTKCMEQILAATWSAEDRLAIHRWTQQVLVRSLVEVREHYFLPPWSVLRLVSCDVMAEDSAPGIHLPRRISLN